MSSGSWSPAVENVTKWLEDQPFASRPAAVASYLWSLIFENHIRAEQVLRSALISNPTDRFLLNNLAFALANQNKTEEAEDILDRAAQDHNDPADILLKATRGMLMFRKGDYAEGRALYLGAVDQAHSDSQWKYEAMAMLYLAQEEILARQPTKEHTLAGAEKLARKQRDLDVLYLLERVLSMGERTKTP